MAASTSSVPTRIPTKVLDRKHSEWTLYHDCWVQLELLYEGGIRLKNNGQSFALLKRPKELYDVYQERYRRITYQNILQSCIAWYLAKIFQREPRISFGRTETVNNAADERFSDFLQDCDRGGKTFNEFGRNLLETMLLYRRAFVLVDKPQPSAPINTRADEEQQGLDQPYLVMYDPSQVFNWALDQYGNIEWIVIKTLSIAQEGFDSVPKTSAHWWIWDKTTFRHYQYTNPMDVGDLDTAAFFNNSGEQKDGKDVFADLVDGPRAHVLSAQHRVPVRCCELPINLWFSNRAYLHLLEHVDALNGYSWKLFISNHPQLVIQTEDEVVGQTMSEVSFLKFKPQDKIFYLEPDGKSFSESRMYLNEMRQEIYRDFHLQAQGRASSAVADGASGFSKEMEMAPAIDVLNALGDVFRAEQQLILVDYKSAAKMPVDKPDLQPDVNGYRFETKPALADIATAQAAIDMGVFDKSETLEKYADKNIAMSLTDGANEETKETIMKEIDESPTRLEQKDAEMQAQQDALKKSFQSATSKQIVKSEQEAVSE